MFSKNKRRPSMNNIDTEKFLKDFYSLDVADQIFLADMIHKLSEKEITSEEFSRELNARKYND